MPMYQHETHSILLWPPFRLSAMRRELVTCWFNYHFRVGALNFTKSFVCNLHPFLHYCPIIPSSILCLKCTLVWHCDPHFLSCAHSLLRCDSEVCVVCGSAIEALPDHLWSPPYSVAGQFTSSAVMDGWKEFTVEWWAVECWRLHCEWSKNTC